MKKDSCFTLFISSGNDIPKESLSNLIADTVPLFFRLPYTPPYEQYIGLRRLLIQIRRESNLRIPETLVIDLTEWLDHDTEEYFDITVKYLYDHRDNYRYIFVIRNSTQSKYNNMFIKIRTFMSGNIVRDITFLNEQNLEKYITKSRNIDSKAAKLLSSIIMSDSTNQLRFYTVVDNLLDELEEASGNGIISVLSIKKSAENPTSLLGAMMDDTHTLKKIISDLRKDVTHEKEAV